VFSGWSYRETAELLGHPPDPKLLAVQPERLSATGLATVRALYDNEVLCADRLVGRLFALLRRHGLWEDTLVVVLSDHGEEFREHGGWGHGRTVYEELVRVPLIVRDGRHAGVVSAPVALLDVAPTLLELAGVPVPPDREGSSLARLLRGEDDPAFAGRPLLLDVPDLLPPVQALVAGRWKVVRYGRSRPWELYDLQDDPGEARNVAAGSELGARLARELLARHRALEEDARRKGWLGVPQEASAVPAATLDQLRALGYVD